MYQNFNYFFLKHSALLLNKSNHLTSDVQGKPSDFTAKAGHC